MWCEVVRCDVTWCEMVRCDLVQLMCPGVIRWDERREERGERSEHNMKKRK